MDTRCKIYFHKLDTAVTLTIDPRAQEVEMSKILSMFTICPNLKAIHIFLKIVWTHVKFSHVKWASNPALTLKIKPGHQNLIHQRFC